jgi:hypothetical protein
MRLELFTVVGRARSLLAVWPWRGLVDLLEGFYDPPAHMLWLTAKHGSLTLDDACHTVVVRRLLTTSCSTYGVAHGWTV